MQFYARSLVDYNKYLKDPSKKDYVTLASTFGLLIILLIMLYPALLHVSSLNKEVSDGTILYNSLKTKAESLQSAQISYNQVKDELPLLNIALPLGSDIKDYLKTPLESLAAKDGLNLKALQFLDVPVSKPTVGAALGLREMQFNASFTGSYAGFKLFLTDLESYTRITNVSEVNIFLDAAGTLTMNFTGVTNFMDSGASLIPNAVGGAQ